MNKKFMGLMALVAGVAITTFSVSGTYAKYTSKIGTVENTARVAKWFKSVLPSGLPKLEFDVFDTAKFVTNKTLSDNDGENNLVAPGTYGAFELKLDGTTVGKITTELGQPEVAYEIIPAVSVTDGTEGQIKFWIDGTEEYTEIPSDTYYQGNETSNYTMKDLYAKLAEIMTTKVDADGTVKEPGSKQYLHWAWDFDAKGVGTNDENDTKLGQTATVHDIQVKLVMDLNATQINPTENLGA